MDLGKHKSEMVKASLAKLGQRDLEVLRYLLVREVCNRKELSDLVADLGQADRSIGLLVDEGLILVKNKEPKAPLTWEINPAFKQQVAEAIL